MGKKKIVICGGHLPPALALLEILKKRKDYEVYYCGRKYSFEGSQAVSLEYQTINKLGIPFYSLSYGRLQRSFTRYTFLSLFKFPVSLLQSLFLLLRIRPNLVVSFGSYVALPVCLIAWLLKIPIVVHEQTRSLGLANRIISRFAKVICLSFRKTVSLPSNKKIVLTGNPIRESIFAPPKSKITDFGKRNLPLIYITGGSAGSQSINRIVSPLIPLLVKKFRIIHQSGLVEDEGDLKSENYQKFALIDPSEVGSIYHEASLVVGRAGGNTVCEVAAVSVPAIFIPLPWAGGGEQEDNASILKKAGLAEVLDQEKITPQGLLATIEKMMKNYSFYKQNAPTARELVQKDAGRRLVKILGSLLDENK